MDRKASSINRMSFLPDLVKTNSSDKIKHENKFFEMPTRVDKHKNLQTLSLTQLNDGSVYSKLPIYSVTYRFK
jgi:hypothetical protein